MDQRLTHVDREVSMAALSQCKQHLEKLAHWNQCELRQTHYSSIASDYEAIALLSYALGFPLSTVKDAFSRAARAYLNVFTRRATEDAFPAVLLRYDPSRAPDDPEATHSEITSGEGAKDYSLTNSRTAYFAVCEALIAGEDAIADHLALLIFDPPDATYVGARSYCTPSDQHLAYALRALLTGQTNAVKDELTSLSTGKQSAGVRRQASMLRHLACGDRARFIEDLKLLLAWHSAEASTKRNRRNPEFFICIPGLGLCGLAIRRGVCSIDEIPRDDAFLPTDLLAMKQVSGRSIETR